MSRWLKSPHPPADRPPALSLCELDSRVQPAVLGLDLALSPSSALGTVSGLLGGVTSLVNDPASPLLPAPASVVPGPTRTAGGPAVGGSSPAPTLLGGVTDALGLSNTTGSLLGAVEGTVSSLFQSVTTLVQPVPGPVQGLPVFLPVGSLVPDSAPPDSSSPSGDGGGAAPPDQGAGGVAEGATPPPVLLPQAPEPTGASRAGPDAAGPVSPPPARVSAPQGETSLPTRPVAGPLTPVDLLASPAGRLPAAQSPPTVGSNPLGTATAADPVEPPSPVGAPLAREAGPDLQASAALPEGVAGAGAARPDDASSRVAPQVAAESGPVLGGSAGDDGPAAVESAPDSSPVTPAEEATLGLAYAGGAQDGLLDQFFPKEFSSLQDELDACLVSLKDALPRADGTSLVRWLLSGLAGASALFVARHQSSRAKSDGTEGDTGRATRRIPLKELPE